MVVFRPYALSAARSQALVSAEEARFLRSQLDAVSADASRCARAHEARVVRAEASAKAAEARALQAERHAWELRNERDRLMGLLCGQGRTSTLGAAPIAAVDPGALARAIVAEFTRHRSGLPLEVVGSLCESSGEDWSQAANGGLVGGEFGSTFCASRLSANSMETAVLERPGSADDDWMIAPRMFHGKQAAAGSSPNAFGEDLVEPLAPSTLSFDPMTTSVAEHKAVLLSSPDNIGNLFNEFDGTDEQHWPMPKSEVRHSSHVEITTPALLHCFSNDTSPDVGDLEKAFFCETDTSNSMSDEPFDNDAMWGSWQANPYSVSLLPDCDGQAPFCADGSSGFLYTVPTCTGPLQIASTSFFL